MKVKLLIVLCLSLSLALLSDCKKDPQPANPCAGKQLPKADFILAEKLVWEDSYFETDKINWVRDLFLRGPDGYKTYVWQVGTNMNWSTQKNAKVSFDKAEGKLKVRLIATREPMLECFPSDDGIDTVEKWIDVIENTFNKEWISPLQGSWEGKSSQYGDDIYTISFVSKDSLSSLPEYWNHFLYNLTNGCSSDSWNTSPGYIAWSGGAAYTRKTDTGRCVFKYIAYTFPQNKDSIVVEYKVSLSPNADYKPYIFIGKRK